MCDLRIILGQVKLGEGGGRHIERAEIFYLQISELS